MTSTNEILYEGPPGPFLLLRTDKDTWNRALHLCKGSKQRALVMGDAYTAELKVSGMKEHMSWGQSVRHLRYRLAEAEIPNCFIAREELLGDVNDKPRLVQRRVFVLGTWNAIEVGMSFIHYLNAMDPTKEQIVKAMNSFAFIKKSSQRVVEYNLEQADRRNKAVNGWMFVSETEFDWAPYQEDCLIAIDALKELGTVPLIQFKEGLSWKGIAKQNIVEAAISLASEGEVKQELEDARHKKK